MRVVIQCAARKDAPAGSLRMADAREVLFVAHPRLVAGGSKSLHARPDDLSYDGRTWRERLVACNAASDNPLDLLRLQTDAHDVYRARWVGSALSASSFFRRAGAHPGELPDARLRHHFYGISR